MSKKIKVKYVPLSELKISSAAHNWLLTMLEYTDTELDLPLLHIGTVAYLLFDGKQITEQVAEKLCSKSYFVDMNG